MKIGIASLGGLLSLEKGNRLLYASRGQGQCVLGLVSGCAHHPKGEIRYLYWLVGEGVGEECYISWVGWGTGAACDV